MSSIDPGTYGWILPQCYLAPSNLNLFGLREGCPCRPEIWSRDKATHFNCCKFWQNVTKIKWNVRIAEVITIIFCHFLLKFWEKFYLANKILNLKHIKLVINFFALRQLKFHLMTVIKETKALLFADKQSNIKAAKMELLSIHRAIGPDIPSLKKFLAMAQLVSNTCVKYLY